MSFWLVFGFSVFLVSIVPRPSTLLAFADGARFGWRKAVATALGNSVASILQAAAACAGLGLILAKSDFLFLVMKYLGAAYLVYLGVRMWRSSAQTIDMEVAPLDAARVSWRLFRGGFLVAASNPKAILFFTALFPQFLDVSGAAPVQMALMIALVGAVACLVATIYAGFGARLRTMNITRKTMERLHKLMGGLFVSGGIGLAVSRH